MNGMDGMTSEELVLGMIIGAMERQKEAQKKGKKGDQVAERVIPPKMQRAYNDL